MKQKSMHCFESVCEKAKILVDNDMPIGLFHDFLMEIKGIMVDRMIAEHKRQKEESEFMQDEFLCENKIDQSEES